MGLILFIFLMADGRPLDVEDDAQVVGFLRVDELAQRTDEAKDGTGWEAGGVGEAPDRIVGTVKEGIPVDKEEPFRTQSYLPSTIWPRIVLCCSSIIRSMRSEASGNPRKAV
jgi:hypothetical protein